MTIRLEYVNGINKGCICDNGEGKNREYLACTAVSSRWFKTLGNAKDFMEKQGYKLVTFEQGISDYKNDIADIMQQLRVKLTPTKQLLEQKRRWAVENSPGIRSQVP